jgi:hypothetical protein
MLSCSQASAIASAEVQVKVAATGMSCSIAREVLMHCSVTCKPTAPLRLRRTNQEREEGEEKGEAHTPCLQQLQSAAAGGAV